MKEAKVFQALSDIILLDFSKNMFLKLKSGSIWILPFVICYTPVTLFYFVVAQFLRILDVLSIIVDKFISLSLSLFRWLARNSSNNIITISVYPIIMALLLPVFACVVIFLTFDLDAS